MTDEIRPGGERQVPPGAPIPAGYGQPGYGQPGYGQPGYGRPGGWNAAPAPGGIPLRPLGLGDILNGAVTSARRNPAATFGLAAIVMTAYGILTAIIEAAERSRSGRLTSLQHTVQNGQNLSPHQVDSAVTSVLGVLLPAFALTIVLSLVMTSALTGMLSVVIGRGILGRTVSLGEAWRACRLGAVIGTSLLLLLIAVGVPLPVAVVAVVLVLLHLGPVAAIIAVLGGIASVVFEILLGIRLSLTLPALMLERTTPRNAIARSWELSRGSFWRLFGILLLTEIVVGIAATLLSLPFTILGNLAGGDSSNLFSLAASASVAAVILGAIGGIVASTIARPVSAGVAVLLYADLRMRREGLDLALRSAAGSQALTGDEFATAWPPAAGPVASLRAGRRRERARFTAELAPERSVRSGAGAAAGCPGSPASRSAGRGPPGRVPVWGAGQRHVPLAAPAAPGHARSTACRTAASRLPACPLMRSARAASPACTSARPVSGSWQLQLPLRPGGLPLRPLGMGEIFNGAITSMRQAPGAALGSATALSAALATVSAILTLVLNRTLSGGTTATWTEATGLVLGVGVSTALACVLAVVAGRNVLGWPTTAAEAWAVLRPRVAALLGLSVLLLLIYCALWIPAAALIAVAIATGQPLVIVAGSLLGLATLAAELVLWAVLSLAAPALLLERLSPAAAIRRAWRLGFSSFWRVLGIQVLAGAIFLAVAYVLVLPFAGADLALIGLTPAGPSVLSVALAAVGTVISGTVARPFLAGTAALVYCDVRMRREGLDLALRSSQFATAGAVLTGFGLAGHPPPGCQPQGYGQPGSGC